MTEEKIVHDSPTSYRIAEPALRTVNCPDRTRVQAAGAVRHLCPYVDEVDHGTVTVAWTTVTATIELHSLRDYLDTYRSTKVSHEALATTILADVSALPGISDATVELAFDTAGFACRVNAPEDD